MLVPFIYLTFIHTGNLIRTLGLTFKRDLCMLQGLQAGMEQHHEPIVQKMHWLRRGMKCIVMQPKLVESKEKKAVIGLVVAAFPSK